MDLELRIKSTPDECVNKVNAERQRKTERDRGLTDAGTMGYEKTGCYDCDGYNKYCPAYESYKNLEVYINLK